ncbi:unnamed protein product [Musa banksii]
MLGVLTRTHAGRGLMPIRSRRTREGWAGRRRRPRGSPCRRRWRTPPSWLCRCACTDPSCRGSSTRQGRQSWSRPGPPRPRPPPPAPRSTVPPLLPCRKPCLTLPQLPRSSWSMNEERRRT